MTIIKNLVEQIEDELCSAKEYAESAVLYKAEGNTGYAQKYQTMAQDELKHSTYLHDMAAAEIKRLRDAGLEPTAKMQKKWDDSHTEYVEKAAWIKQMLAI